MKQVMTKDLLREIRKSFFRFLSIVLLIGLGTGFFIGLKSTPTDMFSGGRQYFEDYNYQDLILSSTSNFTQKQIDEIAQLKEIEHIKQTSIYHVLTEPYDLVMELEMYDASFYELIEGNEPKSKDEMVLDAKAKKHFSLNETITFTTNEKKEPDFLEVKSYKIVGFVHQPKYISESNRGLSIIGSGELNIFGAAPKEAFSERDPNTLKISLKQKWRQNIFSSSAYIEDLKKIETKVDDIVTNQQEIVKADFLKNTNDSQSIIIQNKNEAQALIKAVENQIAELQQHILLLQNEVMNAQIQQLQNEREEILSNIAELDRKNQDLEKSKENIHSITFDIQRVDENPTFNTFQEGILRLDFLGNVIPLVFFIVAALVTFVIITRMIEQEKKQIGTLKALGINDRLIIRKYIWYCTFSSTMGLIFGILCGIFIFPKALIKAYSQMYIISAYPLESRTDLILFSSFLIVFSVIVIPFLFYRKTLSQSAINLLNPRITVNGNRLFLEKIPFLWDLLTFQIKLSFRTIFRYRIRMFLIFIGILGCMSLLIVGFGARNTASKVQQLQFYDVQLYDMSVCLVENREKEIEEAYTEIIAQLPKGQMLSTYQKKSSAKNLVGKEIDFMMIVPVNEASKLNDFIGLKSRINQQTMTFTEDSVLMTKKLANILNLVAGDEVILSSSNGEEINIKVTGLVENYYHHYLYMGSNAYQQYYGQAPERNVDFIKYKKITDLQKEELLKNEAVASIAAKQETIKNMDEAINQLNLVILVIIISAGVLGFVVIYNLIYITVLERTQELAVVHAMGYRPLKKTFYIFKELLMLIVVAAGVSWPVGMLILQDILVQIELDFLSFPKIDQGAVYLYSLGTLTGIIVVLFILIHFKIRKINVVSSLKDRI